VRLLEERFIRLALEEAGGSVTGAARLLGLNHQTLSALLERRHRNLLPLRRPAVPRRRSLIRP
jgi:transcriptional regulator with GAF, ATPase, and Fis domain